LTESEKDIKGENMKTAVATKEKPATKQNFFEKTRHRQKLALLKQLGIIFKWITDANKLKNDFCRKTKNDLSPKAFTASF
jgi:hypothetical protein